jgi:hypothetical protein
MPHDLAVDAGDVLLFRGSSWISRAIRWFDGSDVNHAGIALGPTALAEATGHGLDDADIRGAIAANERTIQRRLADGPSGDPMVAVAKRYLTEGVPYGYHQIVLLALLAATRRIPLPWVAKRLVRSALDHAADVLSDYVDRDGRQFMICSEYVYRCYDEASDDIPDPYDLALDMGGGAQPAAAVPGQPDTFLQWALDQPEDTAEQAETVAAAAAPAPLGAGPDLVAAEAHLDRLIQEYAAVAAPAEPAIAADLANAPVPLAAAPAALSDPEPSPEELLAAHIRLARALEASRTDPEPLEPLGLGTDLVKGLLYGLVKVEASPNFVTPGDLLLRACRLRTIAEATR